MVEIIMVTLIETSNLSYTTTIRTLSTQEAERIYTFKLLVSKLLGGRGGGLTTSRVSKLLVSKLEGGGGGGVSEIWTMSKIWKFFFEPFPYLIRLLQDNDNAFEKIDTAVSAI